MKHLKAYFSTTAFQEHTLHPACNQVQQNITAWIITQSIRMDWRQSKLGSTGCDLQVLGCVRFQGCTWFIPKRGIFGIEVSDLNGFSNCKWQEVNKRDRPVSWTRLPEGLMIRKLTVITIKLPENLSSTSRVFEHSRVEIRQVVIPVYRA